MIAFAPATPDIRNDKVDTQYHNSIKETFSDTQSRYAVDSLAKFVELNSNKKTKHEINQATSTLISNGSYKNTKERTSTIQNWTEKTANQSKKLTTINNFITNHTTANSKKIRNVDDPLLESTGFDRKIKYCGFKSPAKKIFNQSEVAQTSGTSRAKAVIEPSTLPTSNREDKIIVTSNITNYTQSETRDFAGYFSKKEPSTPSNYNDNYTVGTNSMPQIKRNQRVIIHKGFWKSYFYQAIPKNCYLPTSNQITPSMYDRINQSTRGNKKQGIYTMINPDIKESDIGYERLNNNSLDIVEIKTVSNKNSWSGFNMSKSLAEAENLDDLIK